MAFLKVRAVGPLVFMSVGDFRAHISSSDPLALASDYVYASKIHALVDESAYETFKNLVRTFLPQANTVAIVGSGNWGFSLNPEKFMMPFRDKSDIDIAVASETYFLQTWSELREFHRNKWHTLAYGARNRLRRNGENVYSGFVCPSWIPDAGHVSVYKFKSMLNKLSTKELAYREVKMLYFRNSVELIDYYKRGFSAARRKIQDEI